MPSKSGNWENADFLRELSLALYHVASNGGALSTQAKNAVELYLAKRGHDQSWESIRHCELKSGNMSKVLLDMQKKGHEFTENAFRQHIQKLRKARDTSALDGSGDGGSKPTTPRKATPRKTPTSARKRKAEEEEDELSLDIKDEDGEDTKVTPSKRVKNEFSSEVPDWKSAAFKKGEI